MKILVTGSYGQLGSEFAARKGQHPDLRFWLTDADTLDICNRQATEDFVAGNRIELVINCAAYTAVDKAESEPEAAERVNNLGPSILAEVCKKHSSRLIHISTDYVFDGTACRPYRETDPTGPVSVYGSSKLMGEQSILDSGINAMIIRTSWLYSSGGHNFVRTILRLAGQQPGLRVVADQAGTPTWAGDLAEAILSIIHQNYWPAKTEIYHYSNQGICSWYDFALEILRQENINIPVEAILTADFPTPARRPFYSVLDKSAIKSRFGLRIPHWSQSLRRCLKEIHEKK